MEGLNLLKQDHRKVEKIIEELLNTTARSVAKRRELLQVLKSELQLHEKVEEELFYPKLERGKDKEMILEAYEEHHLVDNILAELEETAPNDEHFKAKLTVLQENLKHHIKEEETEIFPEARRKLGEKKLEQLGEEISKMKEKETAE
jgi:iron-sulfur cluster repair protein YtfE (RIC family)